MVQPIVVGVDGSPLSQEALRLAIEQARLLGTSVRAVHVWHVAETSYLSGFAPGLAEVEADRERARALLADCLDRTAADPIVSVEPVLREAESVADVLVDESADAAMLVVGSRGLRTLQEHLLGSVSHACCRHACCPVLVVPAHAYQLHREQDFANRSSGPQPASTHPCTSSPGQVSLRR